MLIRFLVLIFALNALVPQAFASVGCEKMNDMDMASMSHDVPEVEMDCCLDHEQTCNTSECITASPASFPLSTMTSVKSFTVDGLGKRLKDNLLSLYEIILPINTPPPLV